MEIKTSQNIDCLMSSGSGSETCTCGEASFTGVYIPNPPPAQNFLATNASMNHRYMSVFTRPLPPSLVVAIMVQCPLSTAMCTCLFFGGWGGFKEVSWQTMGEGGFLYGGYFAGEIFIGGNFATLGDPKTPTSSHTP